MANNKKIKKILVTGGTGFLGSNISKYLVNKGYDVTIFDNNSRGKLSRLREYKNRIKFINGDIRNKNHLRKSLNKIDTVIHLAYINGTKFFYEKPIEILEVGLKGIFNVLEICKEKKIKNFILASSSEVYQKPKKVPTDEMEMLKVPDIFNPRYSYGSGKILSELLSIYYGKKYFKKLIIFRPHNIYGADMGNEHVIPNFIEKIKKAKKFMTIKGSGKEVRSFMYIEDFMRAFDLIFKRGKHLEVYNIGTQEKISIINLAKMMIRKSKKIVRIKKSKEVLGNTPIRCPDIKKIKKLGFVQRINLSKGIDLIFDKN